MEWITCENTYEECWRRLLEFANIELAIAQIESIHGPAIGKLGPLYRKQAQQVRVCLLQAKEYFDAARSSSLITQPNHLYYGIVSLASACMLVRGSGEKSLDYLRKDPKHSHHGFEFSFSSDLKRSKVGVSLLENSFIKICRNGHFANWYQTLVEKQPVGCLMKTVQKGGAASVTLKQNGIYPLPSFAQLDGVKKVLLQLVKKLPDLSRDLDRFGVRVAFARGAHTTTHHVESNTVEDSFIFHFASSHEDLLGIVDQFTYKEPIFCIGIQDGATNGEVATKRGESKPFAYPTHRETLDHRTMNRPGFGGGSNS